MMDKDKKTHRYDDMIGLAHHVSAARPHMKMYDRAAQFAAFDALTGFGAAVKETERITQEKWEV